MKLNKSIYIILIILVSCLNKNERNSVSNQNFETINFETLDSVYSVSEVNIKPEFKGQGIEPLLHFFFKEFNLPKQESSQTKVILEFVVDTLGNLNNIGIYNKEENKYTLMDLEGIRVIKLTSSKWECGYKDNKKVLVKVILPINIDIR